MMLGNLKRWHQIVIFAVATASGIVALDLAKQFYIGSAQARLLKQRITPLADQLVASAKVGYLLDRLHIDTEVSSLLNEYNTLAEEEKRDFNASALRYCIIAVIHIGHGVDEISSHKSWISRDKYRAALSECK